MASRVTFDEAKEQMESVAHLWQACHNINFWKFEKQPPPLGAPGSMAFYYLGTCKKSGLQQGFPIDQVDVQHHGGEKEVIRHIHASFGRVLAVMGRAVDAAKAQKRRLILPGDIQHQGSIMTAHQMLERGDHDH